jgi:hypothetical protein
MRSFLLGSLCLAVGINIGAAPYIFDNSPILPAFTILAPLSALFWFRIFNGRKTLETFM